LPLQKPPDPTSALAGRRGAEPRLLDAIRISYYDMRISRFGRPMRPLPDIFKARADSTRLRILRALDGAELHVNEMVDVLELPQPTVSRHLGVLLHAGLVARRR